MVAAPASVAGGGCFGCTAVAADVNVAVVDDANFDGFDCYGLRK